jgi:putative transposase
MASVFSMCLLQNVSMAALLVGSRPYSQLGWKTPSEFDLNFHSRRDLALRYAKGSAQAPVSPAQEANQTAKSELTIG